MNAYTIYRNFRKTGDQTFIIFYMRMDNPQLIWSPGEPPANSAGSTFVVKIIQVKEATEATGDPLRSWLHAL